MNAPTDDEVTSALAEVATPEVLGNVTGWRFHVTWEWYRDAKARKIARFCVMLGQPVSDVLRADLFAALVDEVAAIQKGSP